MYMQPFTVLCEMLGKLRKYQGQQKKLKLSTLIHEHLNPSFAVSFDAKTLSLTLSFPLLAY